MCLTQQEAEAEYRLYSSPTSEAEGTSSQEAAAPQPLLESYSANYPQLAKSTAAQRASTPRVLQRNASDDDPPAKKQPTGGPSDR